MQNYSQGQSMAYSALVILSIVGIAILGVAIWMVSKRFSAKGRQKDLDYYWNRFDDEEGCDCALDYWLDGDRVIEHYGILPTGCPTRAAFCQKAFESLERCIRHARNKFEDEKRNSPLTAERMEADYEYRMSMLDQDASELIAHLEDLNPEAFKTERALI